MSRAKPGAGFTLIELTLALSLSSLVFIALITLAAMAVRQSMQAAVRGEVEPARRARGPRRNHA